MRRKRSRLSPRLASRRGVLRPAIERANAALSEAGRETIPGDLTCHSLRHTYASLMAEAGVDAAYTMAQMGHADARLTLSVDTDVGNRREAADARLDDRIGGRLGTNGHKPGRTDPGARRESGGRGAGSAL